MFLILSQALLSNHQAPLIPQSYNQHLLQEVYGILITNCYQLGQIGVHQYIFNIVMAQFFVFDGNGSKCSLLHRPVIELESYLSLRTGKIKKIRTGKESQKYETRHSVLTLLRRKSLQMVLRTISVRKIRRPLLCLV